MPAVFGGLVLPNVFKVVDAVTITSETTIWTPGAGHRFRLLGFVASMSTAVQLILRDNTAGTVIWRQLMLAGAPVVVPWPSLGTGQLSAAAGNVLTAQGSAAGVLTGVFFGTEE